MIVTLFAGGGDGWALALRALGRECAGIEWEAAECATRAVVGLPTIRADVSTYPTAPLRGRVEGIIAGPPCQDWSSAGKRAGLASARGRLVYEPMRWIEDLAPQWVAMEQVPEVLPIWRQYRQWLVSLGYSAWCGLLDAASYGVPQNRKRAILIASRGHCVQPPEPTHSRSGDDELFGDGRRRWVSMAEGLGWGWDDRPARTVCGDRTVRWAYGDRDGTHGAVLVTGASTERVEGRYERPVDRPAATVDGNAITTWRLLTPGRSRARGVPPATRGLDRPAPTVALGHHASEWCWERPATTIVGSFGRGHVAPPGHHGTGTYTEASGAVPVSQEELSILQGFPADHPWQGNKTERGRQIGNAVPPALAAAVLLAVLS